MPYKDILTELGIGGATSVIFTAPHIVEKHLNDEMIDWTLHTLAVVCTSVIAGVALHLVKKLIDKYSK
jgi:hypothetical protein